MTMKPLVGVALVGLLATLFAPAAQATLVHHTVLVEETGWQV